jgi:hypothetical protein
MFRAPHFGVFEDNPVFNFELRRIKRLATPGRLWLYSAVVQFVPVLLIALLYFLALRSFISSPGTPSNSLVYNYANAYYYHFERQFSSWALLLMLLNAVLFISGSIYAMAVSIHSINHQVSSGHWEMLRLTPLSNEDILEAKEATVHIRAWRVMNLEVAARLALITLLLCFMIFPVRLLLNGEGLFGETSMWQNIVHSFQISPWQTGATLLLSVVALIVFVLEPRWRMRTLSAIGLALSSRVQNLSMASVAGFFGLVGFHFTQVLLTVAFVWGVNGLIMMAYRNRDFGSGYETITLIQFTAIFMYIGLMFLHYRLTEMWSRGLALRHAFRSS